MKVLDKGSVELIDRMGTDLDIVDAARVSFSKESAWGTEYSGALCDEGGSCYYDVEHLNKLSERDTKLINYLARENHWTPFGQVNVKFRIKMPIFVARQAMRSNIGIVWNEESRRYIDSEPEFYEPEVWRGRPEGSIKQGSGDTSVSFAYNHEAYLFTYRRALAQGVAPEMARMVLPQSTYTTVIANFTLAAAARFCQLRQDSHAQLEIQQYANAMSELIEPLFPVAWKALTGKE